MLDYKDIIIKHYALKMSGRKIASHIGASKSGVNEFLKAFEECEKLQYPLPPGITNYGIQCSSMEMFRVLQEETRTLNFLIMPR